MLKSQFSGDQEDKFQSLCPSLLNYSGNFKQQNLGCKLPVSLKSIWVQQRHYMPSCMYN